MKKLIAITVMIALCASAAFAETSLSGNVEARLKLFDVTLGNHGPAYDGGHPKPTTGGSISSGQIKLSNTNDEGTFGGAFRFRYHYVADGSNRWSQAFVWWKPIPQIKIWLGVDDDGMFERGQLTSWAFHQGSEVYLTIHDWDYWRGIFPGNFDTFGLAFSFYVVDGLELNLVVPYGQPNGWPRHQNAQITRTSDVDQIYPGALQLTSSYQIGDVGKIHFSWIGAGGKWDKDTPTYGNVALSFYSGGLVQGLQFQVGASMDIKNSDEDITPKTATAPINVGAGVHFSAGDFGLKWRLGTNIQTAKVQTGVDKYEDGGAYYLTTNVMPTYNLAPVGKICLDIGIALSQGAKALNADGDLEAPDAVFGFWVNPYVKKDINGGYFQIGLLVLHNVNMNGKPIARAKGEGDKPEVKVPVVMGMNF